MPQLPRGVIKRRALRLREAGEAALARHLERQVGRTLSALVERDGAARAEDFTEITFEGAASVGEIAAFTVTGHDGKRALARVA
jgi:threonylcarbamoyladenosine tRNA methylthiotransferase MtaB